MRRKRLRDNDKNLRKGLTSWRHDFCYLLKADFMKPINQADSIDLFEPRLYVLPVIEAGQLKSRHSSRN